MSTSPSATSRRTLLTIWIPVLLICIAGMVITWILFVDKPVPRQIRMATGQEGGAYQAFGLRYQAFMAKVGIQLELVESSGSIANLRQLEDRDVDLAFVQSGTAIDAISSPDNLMALASLYSEPLWLFYRSDKPVRYLAQLAGQRIAIGIEESGTQAVARRFINANGLAAGSSTRLLETGDKQAARQLLQGEIGAAFFVASIDAPYISELLKHQELKLMSFSRSAAYQQRYRFLKRLVLHQGSVSLADNNPPSAKILLAPTAMLVSRNDLHPELIPLLLEAASRIHGDGNLLDEPGEFPSASYLDLPLSKDAARYLEHGPSWLYRLLPYRIAVEIDRLKILLLPLLTLLLPLIKIAPPLYRWRMRARVFRWYDRLREVDLMLSTPVAGQELQQARKRLDGLDADLVNVTVPLSYMAEFYQLQLHINYLRERLNNLHAERSRAGEMS